MDQPRHRPDYERSDADPLLLSALAGGVAFFLLVTPYLLGLLYPGASHQPGIGIVPTPPPPRLQTEPSADLAALRGAEHAQLATYGWVDRSRGIVRIPIDRAIALTIARGLPGWTKP